MSDTRGLIRAISAQSTLHYDYAPQQLPPISNPTNSFTLCCTSTDVVSQGALLHTIPSMAQKNNTIMTIQKRHRGLWEVFTLIASVLGSLRVTIVFNQPEFLPSGRNSIRYTGLG